VKQLYVIIVAFSNTLTWNFRFSYPTDQLNEMETHICTPYSEILGRHNYQFTTNLADAATLGIL
jgi:hypothetical protein